VVIQLAWKNIWRNKKRSLILVLATCFGIWGGIFTSGISVGMWEGTIESAIDRELSHIQIHHPKFRNEKLVEQFIPDIDNVRKKLLSENLISAYSERVIVEGIISSPVSTRGVKILGIEPSKEKKVTSIYRKVIEGGYFAEDKENQIVIGSKLAEQLKVKLNSKVVLSFQSVDNNLVASAFRVAGIFKTESSIYDASVVFVNKKELQSLLGAEDIVHEVAIRVSDVKLIDVVKNRLRANITNVLVEDWEEIAPEYALTRGILYIELNIFMGIILFALLFGISNTMMMSVFERIREFGMLMAIGMKRSRLFGLIISESVMLLFTGGSIGTFLGWITVLVLSKTGVNLSMVAEGLSAYSMPVVLYPEVPLHMYISLFLMMLATAIIASISPAVKAVRLKPVEAMRTF
jgi:ABC-type lipoprotein release transport system permease subunit